MKEYLLDWNGLLGSTLKQKFECLYVHLIGNIFPVVEEKVFVLTSPELASIFECMANSPEETAETASPAIAYGDQDGMLIYSGNCNKRFRIYKSSNVPVNEMHVYGKKDIMVVKIGNFEKIKL